MTQDLPSPKYLCQILHFDTETGNLSWKERPVEMFSCKPYRDAWNTRYVGQKITRVNTHGYIDFKIMNKTFLAHRVVWAMHTGSWPIEQIDHINGDKADNRIENLRLCSHSQNAWNRKKSKNNKSGFKGVSFVKKRKKWKSVIMVNGKSVWLGMFDHKAEAAIAYKQAAEKYHGDFANW
jgi:hypothetical protein